MNLEFEYIVPWNGIKDTGKDVRLKWERNFKKIINAFKDVEDRWERYFVEKTDPQGQSYLFTAKPIVTAAGVTMYSGDTPYLPSMFEGIPLDGETLAWVDGKITVIGGTGQGGITGINVTGSGNAVTGASLSADGLTITLTKGSEFALKSDIPSLSGYATESWVGTQLGNYVTSSSLKTVSDKLNNFLEGTDTDGIINKWKELENFLAGQTQTSTLAQLLSVKADKSVSINAGAGLTGGGTLAANRTLSLSASGATAGTYTKTTVDVYGRVTAGSNLSDADIPPLDWSKIATGKPTTIAGYGITDAYTKNEINTTLGNYVTKSGAQDITGVKSFINGLKIGNILVKKHADGVVEIDGDLIVTGGVTMYAQGSHTASTILDALPIDADTLSKEGGVLSVIGGGGGSVDGIILNGTTYSPNADTKLITLPNYPTSLPASDVYAWAKASVKPSYTFTELTSHPTTLSGYGITDGVNSVSVSGSGNAVTSATVSGHSLTLTKGATFLTSHQSLANYVTLNTIQTITNTKTFTASQKFDRRSIYFQNDPTGGSAMGLYWQKNGWGAVKAGIGTFTSSDGDPTMFIGWGESPWNAATNFHVSNADIQYKGNNILHTGNYTSYLDSRYVNAAGDTMTGPLVLAHSNDTKIVMQSTDTDNYCLISMRNSSGTQLSYLGYTGNAWKIDGYVVLHAGNYSAYLDSRYYTESESNSRFALKSGDVISGRFDVCSVGTADYSGGIVLRENNRGGSLGGSIDESPRISFHWGGRYVKDLAMAANGKLVWNKFWNINLSKSYVDHGASSTKYTVDEYYNAFIANTSAGYSERGSWYYAGNGTITTDFGDVHLAGVANYTWHDNVNFKTMLFITPGNYSAGTDRTNEMLFYSSNGSGYAAGWTRVVTNRNYSSILDTRYYTKSQSDSNYVSSLRSSTDLIYYHRGGTETPISINVSNAPKWSTARTLSLTGAVSGSVSMDGSANVSLSTAFNFGTLDGRYYTESEADARFVNVSGDTMTNELSFNGNVFLRDNGSSLKVRTIYGSTDFGMKNSSWCHIYTDAPGFYFNKTDLRANGNTIWHAGNDGPGSGLNADLLDDRHRSDLYNGISHFLSTVGTDIAITVAGDANTYYPVYIEAGGQTDKNIVGYLSVYKNLGSATASYPGNHSNGTSSLWVSYEFRSNIWDGNGGYVRTMYKYEGYATLISQVATYSPKHGIVVWLRGGGTEYRISYSNGKPTASIYYSETNLNNSQYPAVVAPRTDIGNGGIAIGPTIYTNVESATKLQTSRTLWGQSFNGTANVSGDMSNVGTILSSANNTKRIGSASNQWEGIYAGWISGGTNQSLRLAANNADKVWILTNGNVGIGTSSPSYKLHVNGGIYATGTSDINGTFRCGTSLLHKFIDQDYLIRDKRALVGASDALYISYAADWGTVNIRNSMVIVNGDGLHCANWLRVAGSNGIYFSDRQGGLHMEDSTWVKVYNSKAFRVNSLISCGDSASYNDNQYGIMNVTRPTDKDYCCYAFVKNGIKAFGMGFTTGSGIWLGAPNTSKVASDIYLSISSTGIYSKGLVQANNGKLKSVYNGQTFDVGSDNSSYCHYNTTAGSHWFNKQVSINGTLYPYGAAQNIGSKDTPWGNIYSSGWFRSTGDNGWYSEKYGGGIHMTDTTYVRVYNGRSLYVPGNILATGGVTMYGSDVTKKDVISRVLLPLDYIAGAPLWRYKWNDRRNDRVNVGGSAQYTRMMLGELVGESDKGLVMDYATTAYAFSVCTARHFRDFLDNEFRIHETEIDKLKKENEKMKRRIEELERRARNGCI